MNKIFLHIESHIKWFMFAFQLPFAEVRILNSFALGESGISFTGFLHHKIFSCYNELYDYLDFFFFFKLLTLNKIHYIWICPILTILHVIRLELIKVIKTASSCNQIPSPFVLKLSLKPAKAKTIRSHISKDTNITTMKS